MRFELSSHQLQVSALFFATTNALCLPNSRPGVYRVDCKCVSAAYAGEKKKKIRKRLVWLKCPQSFYFDNTQMLAVES